MSVLKTKFHSFCTGQLAKGCEECVKGRKLVLFITGLCGQRCFYCPVSEHKYGKDVVYANEWKVSNLDDPVELLKEAKLIEARGAGITGGDPLVKVDRCCTYIRLLKEKFGKKFHVHLYTPLKLVTEERLNKLFDAGLDEIRIHLDVDDESLWSRLDLVCRYSWDVGIEIPCIPGRVDRMKRVVDFVAGRVKFLNLNELELSDTQTAHYKMDGFRAKNSVSYGVEGSEESGLEVLKYAEFKGLPAHFCTAKLKDGVQVANRLKIRSKNSALWFDIQTGEGLLLRGCVYLPFLSPGFGYREKLKCADVSETLVNLEVVRDKLLKLGILSENIVVDRVKLRILLPRNIVLKFADRIKKLDLLPAVVEEYPTADATEIDVEFV